MNYSGNWARISSSSYVGHVTDTLALDRFLTEFKIVAKHNSRPWDLSASYLKRLFFEGSSARDRGFTKYGYNQESDLHSSELSVYMNNLLDHSILWKTDAHTVICTAFPYGTKEQIMHSFYSLNDCINGPSRL